MPGQRTAQWPSPLAPLLAISLLAILLESVKWLFSRHSRITTAAVEDDPDFHGGKCDPSMELSNGYVGAAMENSAVREVETVGAFDQWTKGIM